MRRHRRWPSASGSENDLDRVPGLSDESESFRGFGQREDVCDQIRDVDAFLLEEIDRFADVPRAPPVRGRQRDLFPPEGVERNVDLCGRLDRREEYDRPAAVDRGEALRDHLRSAGSLREFDVQQSGDAAAEYEDRASRTETREPLTPDHAGERLHERGLVIRAFPREWGDAMLHVDRGHADELGKPTRIEVRRTQGLADGLVTGETVSTRTTR